MKKINLFLMLICLATAAKSQQNVVASAYNYLKSGMPDKAIVEIDNAITNESTKDDAKTWFYRGNIYLQLYSFAHMTDGIVPGLSSDDLIKIIGEPESRRSYKKVENGEKWYYPNELVVIISNKKVDSYDFPGEADYKAKDNGKLLDEAYKSYVKSAQLDPTIFKPELNPQNYKAGLDRIAKMYYNDGVIKFQNKKVEESIKSFEMANKVFADFGQSDDNLLLYTGYAYETFKDTTNAIKYYDKLVAKKTQNANLYISLASLYMGQHNYKKAIDVVTVGNQVLPGNQNLLITQANVYLQSNQVSEAEKILKLAAEKDPNNEKLQFAIGANYDKVINDTSVSQDVRTAAFEKGKEAYVQALTLKPDYFDAAYNLGAMLNNKAASDMLEANNYSLDETEKYDKKIAESKDLLKEAKPYLEKCHTLDPNDRNTMIMLRSIYQQTNDVDNYKKMNELLKK